MRKQGADCSSAHLDSRSASRTLDAGPCLARGHVDGQFESRKARTHVCPLRTDVLCVSRVPCMSLSHLGATQPARAPSSALFSLECAGAAAASPTLLFWLPFFTYVPPSQIGLRIPRNRVGGDSSRTRSGAGPLSALASGQGPWMGGVGMVKLSRPPQFLAVAAHTAGGRVPQPLQ